MLVRLQDAVDRPALEPEPLSVTTRVLSCGGGLDSFTMLLLSIAGDYKPDVVAFVDVANGSATRLNTDPGEWPGTYRHIREVVMPLCAANGIEFVWIDSTMQPVRDADSLFSWMWMRGQIPVAGPNRICTRVAKVERFERWCVSRWPGQTIDCWIGFEAGEEDRAAKDPNAGQAQDGLYQDPQLGWGFWRKKRLDVPAHFEVWFKRVNRFPLMDLQMCRCRAEQYVRNLGYPIPRKSACVFCPYASKGDWQTFARELPREFARTVELERRKPETGNGKEALDHGVPDAEGQGRQPHRRVQGAPAPGVHPGHVQASTEDLPGVSSWVQGHEGDRVRLPGRGERVKLILFGVEHTTKLCPSCKAMNRAIRRETLMPVPAGAFAPLSRTLKNTKICFDCAAAESLKVGTFEMARIATGNDRQEKLRLPGLRMGIPTVRPAQEGDLERLQAWHDTLPEQYGCDSLEVL